MTKSLAEVVYKELLEGKTHALVMEHELHGVTPEMIDWWWDKYKEKKEIAPPPTYIFLSVGFSSIGSMMAITQNTRQPQKARL